MFGGDPFFVDAEIAFAGNRHRVGDINAGLAREFGELRDEAFSIGGELVLEFPILRLGIVRAEHDNDNVRRGFERP